MKLESWRTLVVSLPTGNTALRMRLWRGMKTVGAASLRDGVWVMPSSCADVEMHAISGEVSAAGGAAEIIEFRSRDAGQDARLRGLFDRSAGYAGLLAEIRSAHAASAGEEGLRALRRLRRAFAHLAAIDFFPGAARAQVEGALLELDRHLCHGEPGQAAGAIHRLNPADYQRRTWATRARPWVDRLASAWLIARHIDRRPRFVWLDSPAACPEGALGFDFDGAAFSHVGGRVTFETLLASFGLEGDQALVRLGGIVHALDVGGVAPEAAGLECVLRGLRRRHAQDDALLRAASQVFDDMYAVFREEQDTE